MGTAQPPGHEADRISPPFCPGLLIVPRRAGSPLPMPPSAYALGGAPGAYGKRTAVDQLPRVPAANRWRSGRRTIPGGAQRHDSG
jgi:hypothetical protein